MASGVRTHIPEHLHHAGEDDQLRAAARARRTGTLVVRTEAMLIAIGIVLLLTAFALIVTL